MHKFGKRKAKVAIAVIIACIAAVGAYAFTASNTVTAHYAGAGSATVTGYTVSSPTNYTFSADGTTIVSVSFQLNHAASDVAVALTDSTPVHSDWQDCGASSGGSNDVTCTFATPIPVGATSQTLTVAAVETGTVTIS
jgi:hypothetical protein